MKNLTSNKNFRIMALVLIFTLTVLYLAPSQLEANVCDEALVKCGVDAVIVTLFSGPASGFLYFSGCLIGHDFCEKYYLRFKK